MKQLLFDSVTLLDFFVWILVICFFCGSSLISGGNLQYAFLGACGIIVEMFFITVSIELIIDSLQDTRGIGTITGFITNGPEALCLLVGLFAQDIIFAASTPLGSNFMNPLLLFVSAIITGKFLHILKCKPLYNGATLSATLLFAVSFFFISQSFFLYWLILVMIVTIFLFFLRPDEPENLEIKESPTAKTYLLPAIIVLTAAGYLLDSVVTFAAENANAPKGVIGFLVLATLTSWPEFKSCLCLLQRNMVLGAILNITVSNITNIWLAASGIGFYIFLQ